MTHVFLKLENVSAKSCKLINELTTQIVDVKNKAASVSELIKCLSYMRLCTKN